MSLTMRLLVKYWLPVLAWMALIFSASSDSASFQHSSRFLGPLFHWLWPGLSPEAVRVRVLFVRKCAHLTEYAILALLLWRALRKPEKGDPRPWQWSLAGRVTLFVLLYAATDEFHQLFVPTREASVRDVLFDGAGAVLALLLLWRLGRWRKRW